MVQVLLFPEDIRGTAPFETAVYASVTEAASAAPRAVLLSHPQGATVLVNRDVVRGRAVPDNEFQDGAPGEIMRRAVVGVQAGGYVFGQAVSYDGPGGSVTIRSRTGDVLCDRASVSEVAPVVAFALSRSAIQVADVSRDDLYDIEQLVLDRIMGLSGEVATRSIPRVLRNLIPTRAQPRASDTLMWVNSDTGRGSLVTVRHAIDYAHYVDGGRRIPPSVESQLGSSFDADPSQGLFQASPAVAPGGRVRSEDVAPADAEDESLESLLAALQTNEAGTAQSLAQASARAPAQVSTPVAAQDSAQDFAEAAAQGSAQDQANAVLQSRVLQAISDDPVLIRYYLSQCQHQGSKRPREDDDLPAAQRARFESPSDLLEATDASDRSRQKHHFRPSRVQQAVHRLIVAPDHAGKTPVELMDAMISSRATRFMPHPGVLIRFYDFQFGIRGLSVMHFQRFDFAARRRWYTQPNVNLNNFGPTVDIPRAQQPSSLNDLADALSVLHVVVDEFMDTHARRFVGAAKEFVEDLRGYSQWSGSDIVTLAFWFDGVFEDFRRAVEKDVRHGCQSRSHIGEQFSFQNPQLQAVLYAIQSERLALLQVPMLRKPHQFTSATTSQQQSHGQPQPPRRSEPAAGSKIPREVLDALPRQGSKTCCMRFLSNAGCFSRTPGKCTASTRGHFVPVIPPVVRQYIDDNMGGVRSDIQQ